MIAGDRKKIIKMTQGDRLFNVILIISVSWQWLSNLFGVWNRSKNGEIR